MDPITRHAHAQRIRLQLDRYYLGLHGLALMRSYPYGDPEDIDGRKAAMRALLDGEGPDWVFEEIDISDVDTSSAYSVWAETYDEANALIQTEERALLPLLDELQPGDALDVGTGTGRLAHHLVNRGHHVVACDASAEMLERASPKLPSVNLVRADAMLLPFGASCFDSITCGLALSHVPDLGPVLAEFARVLRPGGTAVISDIHPMAVALGSHAFFRADDGRRWVTRNQQHWVHAYVGCALAVGFTITGCAEALVDESILTDFGVPQDPAHPEYAINGLPFAIVWTFRT